MSCKCKYCKQELKYTFERGWVHTNNGEIGGIYMQTCRNCGWKGSPFPPTIKCPNCGSIEVYDDHCAMPEGVCW